MTIACVLGCQGAQGLPYLAAPGQLACLVCEEKLAGIISDIRLIYATLTDVEELIPSGSHDGGRRAAPGSRSPAVDSILVHTDARSAWDGSPAALATVESWVRVIRSELSLDVTPEKMRATVPSGRVTMERELATVRFNWPWVMRQLWLDEFAAEMRNVLAALKNAGRLQPKTLRLGACPGHITGTVDGQPISLVCGATLRVQIDAEEIRCYACRTVWPRSQWSALGDPWTDYARLSEELHVPVGTLKRWAFEDRWTIGGTRGRRLIIRTDAHASYVRRRGPIFLEETG